SLALQHCKGLRHVYVRSAASPSVLGSSPFLRQLISNNRNTILSYTQPGAYVDMFDMPILIALGTCRQLTTLQLLNEDHLTRNSGQLDEMLPGLLAGWSNLTDIQISTITDLGAATVSALLQSSESCSMIAAVQLLLHYRSL